MTKKRILLVIPDDDLSIDLFSTDKCRAMMTAEAYRYEQAAGCIDQNWDYVYIRDPFVQSDFENQKVRESIDKVLQNKRGAHSVDGIQQFSDLLIEDKWRQYELFAEFMPATAKLKSFKNLGTGKRLIKKRLSGRSRDIHFSLASLPDGAAPADYIIQDRLNIRTEYRVFMLGGEIVLPLEIKSSKTKDSRNQVIGLQVSAPREIREICRQVVSKLDFDLMGLDIARTEEGYYLLEVNRSPQFVNYLKLSSQNLAEKLMAYLIEKKSK